jgi:hypothetical protein
MSRAAPSFRRWADLHAEENVALVLAGRMDLQRLERNERIAAVPPASVVELQVRADRSCTRCTEGDCGCYSEQTPRRVIVGCLSFMACGTCGGPGDLRPPPPDPRSARVGEGVRCGQWRWVPTCLSD